MAIAITAVSGYISYSSSLSYHLDTEEILKGMMKVDDKLEGAHKTESLMEKLQVKMVSFVTHWSLGIIVKFQ